MKFELMFNTAAYRVSQAKPEGGESVVMDPHHFDSAGMLITIPYLASGHLMSIDCLGQSQHYYKGDSAEGLVFPIGKTSMIALEKCDYWCISPLPGNRLIREGKLIIEAGGHAVLDLPYETNALFTDNAHVNGTLIPKGTVARVSLGQKNVSQPDGRELHVILFNTEPV